MSSIGWKVCCLFDASQEKCTGVDAHVQVNQGNVAEDTAASSSGQKKADAHASRRSTATGVKTMSAFTMSSNQCGMSPSAALGGNLLFWCIHERTATPGPAEPKLSHSLRGDEDKSNDAGCEGEKFEHEGRSSTSNPAANTMLFVLAGARRRSGDNHIIHHLGSNTMQIGGCLRIKTNTAVTFCSPEGRVSSWCRSVPLHK
jgi:hypothetical protein